MSDELRGVVTEECGQSSDSRMREVLRWLGIPRSSWYARSSAPKTAGAPGRRGLTKGKRYDPDLAIDIERIAKACPWWGYKRIAAVCRRHGLRVSDRLVYRVMRDLGLLQTRKRTRQAGVYQASKLYELLPKGPNELWQMDVTYIHIAGYGWRYGVTVIDYYSRYLLAATLTASYSAHEVTRVLEAARHEAERVSGPITREPFLVTDNGSSFIARRFMNFVRDDYVHVRIQYRTPTQLGLLERFHQTLKDEEVYWRMYDNPTHAQQCLDEFRHRYNHERPHWALIPETGGDPLVPYEVYACGEIVQLPKWQAWARKAKEELDRQLLRAA